jgi:hypothetical protein
MPGDRENIVRLNADHSGVCKFDQSQIDQDNFELVRSNIKDLYKNALKIGELGTLPSDNGQERSAESVDDGNELQARWAKLKGDRV